MSRIKQMNKATAAKVPGDTCVLGSFISVFSRPRTDPLQQQLWQSHQTSGLPSEWDKKNWQQHVGRGWRVLRHLEMWVLLQLCWAVIHDDFLSRSTLRNPQMGDTASWVQTQQLNHSVKPVSVLWFFLTFMLLCFCFSTTEQDKTQCHSYRFKNCVEGIPFGKQTVPLLPSKEALTWLKEQKALSCLQGCYRSQMMTSAHNQCQRAVHWTACTNTPQHP